MIRILVWNIQRFGANKLDVNRHDILGSRNWYILNTINASAADIVVVIEVTTGAGPGFGGVINGAGQAGSVRLLTTLGYANPAAAWKLVPPLIISPGGGYSEGIAVFFKSSVLNFWGPNMIDAAGATGVPIAGAGAGLYGGTFANALPGAASTNPLAVDAAGTAYNQNQLAGRHQFFDATGAQVLFPGANDRSVWMTQFSWNPGGGAAARTLSLFAAHFPPHVLPAMQAFGQLANVPEISGALAVNEDRVVCGDFNVNAASPAQAAAFANLTAMMLAVPYTQELPAGGVTPTSLMSVMTAKTTGLAPYYGYVNRSAGGVNLSLDGIFTARQGGAAAAANPTVVNRVVGTPPVFPIPPMVMLIMIPAIIAGLPPGGPRARSFRNVWNFGMIGGTRGTSDHEAMSIDLP